MQKMLQIQNRKTSFQKSGAEATQPQLHRGDLEDHKPHKIISKKNPIRTNCSHCFDLPLSVPYRPIS